MRDGDGNHYGGFWCNRYVRNVSKKGRMVVPIGDLGCWEHVMSLLLGLWTCHVVIRPKCAKTRND